jgi:hypothetical protein
MQLTSFTSKSSLRLKRSSVGRMLVALYVLVVLAISATAKASSVSASKMTEKSVVCSGYN